jgi:hypothetical protein
MSNNKKSKKNKKSFVNQNNQNKTSSHVVKSSTEDFPLIDEGDDLTKIENKPVDLLEQGTATTAELKTEVEMGSESSNLKLDFEKPTKNSIDEVLEEKLKHDLEVVGATLEHKSVKNESENKTNKMPTSFWAGLIIGALLTYFMI